MCSNKNYLEISTSLRITLKRHSERIKSKAIVGKKKGKLAFIHYNKLIVKGDKGKSLKIVVNNRERKEEKAPN